MDMRGKKGNVGGEEREKRRERGGKARGRKGERMDHDAPNAKSWLRHR